MTTFALPWLGYVALAQRTSWLPLIKAKGFYLVSALFRTVSKRKRLMAASIGGNPSA